MSDTATPTPVPTAAPAVTVVSAPANVAPEKPKAPALAALAAKRAALVDHLYIDIKVPRWNDPEIFVRFGPIDTTRAAAIIKKREDSKVDNWLILANADILATACIGVYATLDGNHEEKFSLRLGDPEGPWTKFDSDLSSALGIPPTNAADCVKALFLTDGDLIGATTRVTTWSDQTQEQTKLDF